MFLRRTLPLPSRIFLVLAVLFGSLAFLVVQSERRRYAALLPAVGPAVDVVVTVADVPRGTLLAAGHVQMRPIPRAFVPPGALTSTGRAVGRVLAADVAAGEVLTRIRLVSARAGPLAALVPGGMRAVPLIVPVPAGLVAGDRVDVLATHGGEGPVYTETVGAALGVLRIAGPSGGPLATAPTTGQPTIVVLSTPDEAERLATAAASAVLHVAVVGPDD